MPLTPEEIAEIIKQQDAEIAKQKAEKEKKELEQPLPWMEDDDEVEMVQIEPPRLVIPVK